MNKKLTREGGLFLCASVSGGGWNAPRHAPYTNLQADGLPPAFASLPPCRIESRNHHICNLPFHYRCHPAPL